MIRPKYRCLVLALCGLSQISLAHTTLLDVYRQAQQSDPIYLQAQQDMLSDKQALPIAIAPNLPQVGFTGVAQRSWANQTGIPTVLSNTQSYTIQATQPLINLANWEGVREASAGAKAAVATFEAAKQNLIVRVAGAYFKVLFAQDTLRFVRAKKLALRRQLDQARQRYKVGLDAITNVYQAKSKYDAAVAEEIGDQLSLTNTLEELRQLTGHYYSDLAKLNGELPLVKPSPNNIKDWVDLATKNNFSLQAQRFATLAKKAEVSVQWAGHMPTLDLNGQYQRNRVLDRSITANAPSEANARSLNLTVTLPLFSGGAVHAATKKAAYDYASSQQALEGAYRNTVVTTRSNFNSIISGISLIKADRQSIFSTQASLKSTEAAYRVGTKTIIEVLNTQTDLFDAQQKHAQDQYQFISDVLALKEAAGSLNEKDLIQINNLLQK